MDISILEWIAQDSRHACAGCGVARSSVVMAIASLALGIGANTAIFSFVNAILLKRLPVPHPDRLVRLAVVDHGERGGVVWRMQDVNAIAQKASTLDGLFGWFSQPVSFSGGDSARWIIGEMVTGQYFPALEVQSAVGRLFGDDDVRNATGNPVCVLSYTFWRREFNGDPGVVGRNVILNGHAYRVLGVTARGFTGAALEQRFDVVVPATRIVDFMPAFGGDRLSRLSWMAPMARLKPGVSRDQAAKEIDRQSPDWHKRELVLEDGSQGFSGMRRSFGRASAGVDGSGGAGVAGGVRQSCESAAGQVAGEGTGIRGAALDRCIARAADPATIGGKPDTSSGRRRGGDCARLLDQPEPDRFLKRQPILGVRVASGTGRARPRICDCVVPGDGHPFRMGAGLGKPLGRICCRG